LKASRCDKIIITPVRALKTQYKGNPSKGPARLKNLALPFELP